MNKLKQIIREELDKLYHGSPHDHDKFDVNKILTGEGNISFGWGLYFTDSESIAKHYANSLSRPKLKDSKGNKINISKELGNLIKIVYTVYGVLNEDSIKKYIYTIAKNFGNLEWVKDAIKEYENIPEDFMLEPFRFLYTIEGFDKPLVDFIFLSWESEVDERIKNILKKNNIEISNDIKTGADLYHSFVNEFNSEKKVSLYLRNLGIDGIIYKSGTFIKSSFETKSKNYVIFDDKNIKITDKEMF